MGKKKTRTEQEEVVIFFSAYATHKEYTISEWLDIKSKLRQSKKVLDLLKRK